MFNAIPCLYNYNGNIKISHTQLLDYECFNYLDPQIDVVNASSLVTMVMTLVVSDSVLGYSSIHQ